MSDLCILAAYAHPDDEQGVSGTLRKYMDQGAHVGIICATRGEVGQIADPTLATPEILGVVREQELRRAMAVIGVPDANIHFLDYRDSGMAGTPENADPRAFINADAQEAVGKIVKIIRAFKPTIILTFDETGGYGHPDHLAIHRWTTQAFHVAGDPAQYPEAGSAFVPKRLYYSSIGRSRLRQFADYLKANGVESVFGGIDVEQMGLPDERITNEIPVAPYVALKRRSLGEHRTQLNPNGPFASIPEEQWNEFRSTEIFGLGAGEPFPPGYDRRDLFAGLL
jgi:LmbE family N-acetylglucosaminyl deacetylase